MMKENKKVENHSSMWQTMDGNISYTQIPLTQTYHLNITVKDPIVFLWNSSMSSKFRNWEQPLHHLTMDALNPSKMEA